MPSICSTLSPERVAQVNAARCRFTKTTPTPLLAEAVRSGLIKATTDPAVLEDAAAVIVTIGTPVDEYLDPSVGEFDRSMNELLDRFASGTAAGPAQHRSFPA